MQHDITSSAAPGGDKPLPKFIRRSLVALSINDPRLTEKASACEADAIVLQFDKLSGSDWQQELRARMPAAIHSAARAGAEVFVRIARNAAIAELDAAVFSGLTGIVLTGVSGSAEVRQVCDHLARIEERRGIARNCLEISIDVDNPAAVWHSLDIARASPRFGMLIVNEQALCVSLGMQTQPQLAFDPLEYIKSQLITVALAAGGQAVGMSYPLGLTGQQVEDATLKKAVRRARDTGFKGAMCPHVSWVAACNVGFRPSDDEAAYYRKVIEVFAEGLKRGMASVPLDGKMVDVPVDVRAKLYLQWANRAAARDAEKARARAASS